MSPEKAMDLLEGYMGISKFFFSIYYNKLRDKISLSRFESGYAYKYKTGRIYPIRKNISLLCFSRHIYAFQQINKGRRVTYQPRIYTGRHYNEFLSEYLRIVLNCSKEILKLHLSYRYMECRNTQEVAFRLKYDINPIELMYKLGIMNNYNVLIDYGGKDVPGYCKMLEFRLSEGAMDPDFSNIAFTTCNILNI